MSLLRHNPFSGSALRGLLILLLGLGLSACGGGGTSGAVDGMGSVGIVLTDAPSDEFQAINMTIVEILLLPDDDDAPPVSVFSGEQTVDLLSLRDHAELFALDDVPAGRYEKIRLILKQPDGLELVTLDGASHYPSLPGNGKLDLNPRGDFSVQPGEVLYLQIDVDADKSIHVRQTGNGRYQFRPVVFVDIIDDRFSGKLVRRTGYVEALAADYSRFALCRQPQPVPYGRKSSGRNDDDDDYEDGDSRHHAEESNHDDDHEGDDDDRYACIHVELDDASLFGADGLPLARAELNAGERVTAIGFLQRSSHDSRDDDSDDGYQDDDDLYDDDDDHRVTLYAEVIEVLADGGGFETVKGAVATEPADAVDSFVLTLADGSELNVQLQDGTRVFARDGKALDVTDILVGLLASVDGVRADDGSGGELLRASLVVLDTASDSAAERIMGTLNRADPASRTLELATASGDVSVRLAPDGMILLLGDYEEGARSESGDFADLTEGRRVEIYGRDDAMGYFVARVILVTD